MKEFAVRKKGRIADMKSSLRSRLHVDGLGAHLANNFAEMTKFRLHQFHVSEFEILLRSWGGWAGT